MPRIRSAVLCRRDIDAGQRRRVWTPPLRNDRPRDHPPDQIHARFQFFIAIIEQRVGSRIAPMHADRLIGLTVGQIAENSVDERRQRRISRTTTRHSQSV